MEHRHLLFFDIETVEDKDRSHLWQSKKEKVELENKDKPDSERKEFIPALCPEFCIIVALGWAFDDEPPKSLIVGVEKESRQGKLVQITEQIILDTFWKLVIQNNPVLVGFNIINFDLPAIFVRSALLSVKPTKLIERRSWKEEYIDLLETRRYTNGGGKLKELASYFSFDVPAQDIDGSQVDRLFTENPAMLAQYVESDITVTRQLYDFYKGFFVTEYAAPPRKLQESKADRET